MLGCLTLLDRKFRRGEGVAYFNDAHVNLHGQVSRVATAGLEQWQVRARRRSTYPARAVGQPARVGPQRHELAAVKGGNYTRSAGRMKVRARRSSSPAVSVDGALASSAFSRCVRRKTRAAHDKTTNMCARLAVSNDIVTSACAFPLETQ